MEQAAGITVYVAAGHCPNCTATTRALARSGIDYAVAELTPESIATFKAEGMTAAPVVVTSAGSWCGFRPDRIIELRRL